MRILLILSLILTTLVTNAQVENWTFESIDSLQNSILNLAEEKENRELLHWQMYKYTLRSDSFKVPGPHKMIRDSTVKHFIKYDTAFQSKALAITRRDSFHITYHDTLVQDSVWRVGYPSFVGFMEWKLKQKQKWIYLEPYSIFWKKKDFKK